MDPKQFNEWSDLSKGVSRGEWIHDDGQMGGELPKGHSANKIKGYETEHFEWRSYPAQYGCDCGEYNSDKDAEFFIASRTAVPQLIEAVNTLTNGLLEAIEHTGKFSVSGISNNCLAKVWGNKYENL